MNTEEISLHISRSSMSTRVNKTGSWRYVRPVFDPKTAPCSAACPAGEDIPRIEMLMARGREQEALETLLLENPLPAVCGHVCFHPCESACNRSFFDEAVAVHHMERFIGGLAVQERISAAIERQPPNRMRVAVVGAGPAGLSAAYFLRRLGFDCDVHEAEASAGGLLRHGIPAYRLPQGVVEKEVERIAGLGVRFVMGRRVSEGFLREAGGTYQAVVVGCGHARALAANIPGESWAEDGLAFLKKLRRGQVPSMAGTVAVIGGGNTAVDVARCLVRLGAEPVIVYRRRREDMPAFPEEVDAALDEGVRLMTLVSPLRLDEDGRDRLLTLQNMQVSPLASRDGRARVAPVEGRRESLRVQHVVTAIGAAADPEWLPPQRGDAAALRLSHCTATFNGTPLVFGGDLVNRFQSVADAIASGKAAAMVVDTYLKEGRSRIEKRLAACRVGDGPALSMAAYMNPEGREVDPQRVSWKDIRPEYFSPAARIATAAAAAADRIHAFAAVSKAYSADDARREAARCFNCGTCNACGNCDLFCPEVAVSAGDRRSIDLDYCKGCGVCVAECPRNAMSLREETHEADC